MFDRNVVIVDVETTSLDRSNLVAWDVGLVTRTPDGKYSSEQFFVEVTNRELERADIEALDIGNFDERYNGLEAYSKNRAAHSVFDITKGAYFAAVNPDFDAFALTLLLKQAGLEPGWSYRLIDIRTLAVGYYLGMNPGTVYDEFPSLHTVAEMLEFDPIAETANHTAIGDAEYEARLLAYILGD